MFQLKHGLFAFLGIAAIITVNYLLLFPKYFATKKYLFFILGGIIATLLIVYLVNGIQEWVWPRPEPPDFRNRRMPARVLERARVNAQFVRSTFQAIPILLAYLGSTLLEIVQISNQREKEAILLKNKSMDAEMKFLKSQINPHFLFNAINNIYSQSVLKNDDAPQNLLKLSKMLRYMLYECNTDRIELSREIDYIQNYVELFMLKDSQGMNVKLKLPHAGSTIKIAPLLFIPFIENAFKHSQVEDLEKGWIAIDMDLKNAQLHFNVANSIPENPAQKDEVGGIGLKNVIRRIELLYPGRHEIKISTDDNKYSVALTLQLDEEL
jgi:LytS/YehU family sensor histidine kinase